MSLSTSKLAGSNTMNFVDFLASDEHNHSDFSSYLRCYQLYLSKKRQPFQRSGKYSVPEMLREYKEYMEQIAEDHVEQTIDGQLTANPLSQQADNAASTMISGSIASVVQLHSQYLETKVQGVQGRKRKQAQADDHKEPDWWIKLGLVVKTLNGGEDTAIPSQIPSELSKTHKALFKVARDCMQAFQAAPKKKRDQVLLKDAMVALSCTANLHSPKVGAYFEDDFLARAFNACMDSEIDHHEDLVRWLAPLREIARSGDASDVRDEALFKNAELTRERRRICALGARSLHEKVLDIVQQMCALVIERPFGDSPSETDALIAWANVYKTLLPTGITISTGETWLRATLPVHSELAAELGTEAGEGGGRRVDMRFLYNDIEVSNVELKARSRKTSERATQTRKNLRLARCIQRELERLGVPTPEILFADVSGYMGIFSKVVKLDDIYVAGRVTDQVVTLPTSMYTLRQFLEGSSLSVIINFLSHLERLGMAAWDAAAAKEASDSESDFVEDVEYDVDESYPTEKRFEDNILLTPKKKRV